MAELFKFAYESMDDGIGGIALSIAKGIGLTILSTILGVIGVYAIELIAIAGSGVTVVPMVLLSKYWDGFWDDIAYSLTWMWIAGLMIGFGIGFLAFIPLWFIFLAAIIGGCLCLVGLAAAAALAIPIIILFGICFYIYSICKYSYKKCGCSSCKDVCSSIKSCSSGCGSCLCDCCGIIGGSCKLMCFKCKETCTSCSCRSVKAKSKPKAKPKAYSPPSPSSSSKLSEISKDTIIFDSTIYDKDDSSSTVRKVTKYTIIFDSTIYDKESRTKK